MPVIPLRQALDAARGGKALPVDLHGAIVLCPPSSIQDLWSRKFPDPVTAFASGWMNIRQRAKAGGHQNEEGLGQRRFFHACGDRSRGLSKSLCGVRCGAESQ